MYDKHVIIETVLVRFDLSKVGHSSELLRETAGSPPGVLRESYGSTPGVPRESYGRTMGVPQESYGSPPVVLRESCGSPTLIRVFEEFRTFNVVVINNVPFENIDPR